MREDVTLDSLQRRGKGRLPGLIGLSIVAAEHELVVAELVLREELLAPNGFLHAASIIALADTACGYGCLAHLPDGATNFTTVELKSNFLGTARDGTLSCIAKPAHLGRTTQVWDATVARKADGGTIALFRCTQMVLWPKA
jgi:1,4-dihydroxy-2-naphthoyl-CoA hydrolase